MSREAENALLLLVGIATAMITIGGAYTRYVKASLLPWLTVTAVILIGLALVSMAADIRRGSPPEDDHSDHSHRGSIAWLLLVPIAVLIFITPRRCARRPPRRRSPQCQPKCSAGRFRRCRRDAHRKCRCPTS